jgi:hypothetical protein
VFPDVVSARGRLTRRWTTVLSCAAMLALAVALVGCASIGGSAAGAAPAADVSSWAAGSRWVLMPLNADAMPRATVRVEVTDEVAYACIAGDWRKLVFVGGTHGAVRDPAYLQDGASLVVLLDTSRCDDYRTYKGQVVDDTFHGTEQSFGMGWGAMHGNVVGAKYFDGRK